MHLVLNMLKEEKLPDPKIGIVGASGLVGRTLLKVIEERQFPNRELRLFASEQSEGKSLEFGGKSFTLQKLSLQAFEGLDIVFFVSTNQVSLDWAPAAVAKGALIIDNSKAYRMNPDVPLVVPEINGDQIFPHPGIIANPNCSTVQTVMALFPLAKRYGLKRVVVTTFQSVSGSGKQAVEQLRAERKGELNTGSNVYPHPIFNNCLPHIGNFLENGCTDEEIKMVNESRKILDLPDLPITATTVRVPVEYSHSVSLNVELEANFNIEDVRNLYRHTAGIILKDAPAQNIYPLPRDAMGRDDVFIGRLRRDESVPFGLNMWVVADNLRKGAATNALQIAEYRLKF
ncbi:aspartate-semialdehyde dehydrogenase [bacterium BMS3Abin05]|nr:aspartate-semialdehyde dehydrogenase [bacterium BMS3Abin05]GBE28677.1 aspartate-semialdehyde dehydrogenase [bacterium BMS3Bbin03]